MEIVHTRDNSERSSVIKNAMHSADVINVIDLSKSTGLNRERVIVHSVKADASPFGIPFFQPFYFLVIVILYIFLLFLQMKKRLFYHRHLNS